MNVGELKRLLDSFEGLDDVEVRIVSDYGDYCHKMQALEIDEVVLDEVEYSEYTRSDIIHTPEEPIVDEDDEDYDWDAPETKTVLCIK